MAIITDLLIIDHLISAFVTLPYLPLVFRHLNSLSYFYLKFESNILPTVVSKIAVLVANSEDPDEMLCLQRLIWVYTVCSL